MSIHRLAAVLLVAIFTVAYEGPAGNASSGKAARKKPDVGMSAMGRVAKRARAAVQAAALGISHKDFEAAGVCVNDPECEDEDKEPLLEGPASTQSETSIAASLLQLA
jgi:hypothetical protein